MLGFVVFYTVCDAPVTRDDLVNWFRELGLSEDYLPNELRPIDAAERATGSTVRLAYLLDGAEPERLPNGGASASPARPWTGRPPSWSARCPAPRRRSCGT
ncbi:DUF6744 family protein [Catenulispora yoronensis]